MMHVCLPRQQHPIDFNNIRNYSDNRPTQASIYKKVPTRWSKITKNSIY